MKLPKRELSLLKMVFRSADGLDIGALTWKHGISISEAFQVFSSLKNRRLVTKRGQRLVLTAEGRTWVIENQDLFAFEGEKEWRQVPAHYEANRIEKYEPYAPRRSLIDRKGLLHRLKKVN